MHAHDLLGMATVLTWHGPSLIELSRPLPERALEDYWTASKCRLDRWGHELRLIRDEVCPHGQEFASLCESPPLDWSSVSALCDEILTGEIVTRLWTGLLRLHDARRHEAGAEPIARSVLLGHVEARHRVLGLIMKSYGNDSHEAAALNRLRDRCERWSDILLARFAVRGEVEDLAHDPLRLRDYIEEWSATMTDEAKQARAALLLGSFSAAFPARPPLTANADLNGRIAQSILSIFPPELFGNLYPPVKVRQQQQSQGQLGGAQVLEAHDFENEDFESHAALSSPSETLDPRNWWQGWLQRQNLHSPRWPGALPWESAN
jgi:hypothetical protein